MGGRPNTIRDATAAMRVWLTALLPGVLRCFFCTAILAFFGSAAGAQSGVITTAVGPVLNDSSVSGASFLRPTSVALDSAGNIYTADPYNCVVWKTRYGTTSVFAGVLPSTQYSCPGGTATTVPTTTPLAYPVADAQCNGNIFIAAAGTDPFVEGGSVSEVAGSVEEVNTSGSLSTLPLPAAGGAGGGPIHPVAVACDAQGNVYVSTYFYIADGGFASNVYQFSPVAGGGWTTGIPVEGLFDQAYPALAVNPVNGDLYGILAGQAGEGWLGAPSFSFGSIWDITQNGTGVTSNNTFTNGSALAIDANGNFYIAVGAQSYAPASYVDFVQPNGTTTVIAGTGSPGYFGDGGLSTLAYVDGVTGIALDPTNGYIYLADSENQRVRRIHSLTAGPAALSIVNPSVPQSSSATYGTLQGALNPVTGDFYYVSGTNTVNVINTGASVISPGYERIIASLTVGAAGQAVNGSTLTMAVDSTRDLIYVSNTTDGRLYVIEGSTHSVAGSVALDNPNASLLAIDVALNEVYAGGPNATKVSAVRGGTTPYLIGNAGYPVNSLSVGANSDVVYGVADSGAGGANEEALITMTPDPTTGVLTASIAPFPLNEDVLQPAFIANSIAADPLSGNLIASGAASIDTEFTQTYDVYDIFQFTPNFITAPVPYTWPPITTSLDIPNRVFYTTDFDGLTSDSSSHTAMVTGIDGVAEESNTLISVNVPVFGSGATPASPHVYDAEPDTGSYQAWISGSDATDGGFVRLWDAGSQKVTLSATIPNNGGGHLFVNSSAQSAYLMDEVNGKLWLIDTPQWTPTPAPQFSQATGSQTVTISAVNSGDAVYYTLDGTQPGLESTPCGSPCTVSLTIGEFTLINAIEVATVSGTQIASNVAQGVFTEPAPTSVAVTLSPTPATTGATLTATATITPSNVIPSVTGTVSFAASPSGSFSPVTLCSSVNVALNMGSWQAVCNFVEDSAGSYTIAAAYSGDALNQPSTTTASLNVVQGIIPILGTISGDTNALAINQNNAPGLSYNAVLNTDSSVSLLQDGAILSGQGCPAYKVSGASIAVTSGAIFIDFANSNIYLAMLTGSGLYAAYESINQTTGACTQGPLLQLSGASYGTMQMDVDPTAISSQLGNMYVMMAYGGGITDALYIVPTAPWSASSLPTPVELTLDYSTQYGPMVIDPSNHQLYINDLGGSAYGTVGTYATGGFFVYDPNHSATPASNMQHVVGYNNAGKATTLNVGTLLDNGAGKLVLVNENPSASANISVPITILDTTQFSFFTNTTNPFTYNNDVDIAPGAGLSTIAATSQYQAIGGADINATSNVAYVFAFNSSSLATPGLLLEYNLTPGAATPETLLSSSAAMPNLYDTSGIWSRLNYNPESTELALSDASAYGSGGLGLTSPLCAGTPLSLTQVIGNISNPTPITNPVVNGTSGYVYAIQSGGIYFVAPPPGCGASTPIQISPATLPAGIVGTAYSQTLTASGGTPPYTWSATGLPPGLTINNGSGVITGTPTADAGSTYSVTVTVTDTSGASATMDYSLTITGAALAVTGPASLPAGEVGVLYAGATVTASGGTPPYAWSATGLPSGLTINTSSGVISGTPTADAGSPYSVTVTVTDTSSNTATKNYSLTIGAALTVTGPASLPAGEVGVLYAGATVTASGGTPPYAWSATGLPPGLTINIGSGVITGTPTADAGSPYSVTVTVTDTSSNTATKNYSLTIGAALTVTGPASLPAGEVGVQYAGASVTASGGTPPYAWSATGLPSGLTINIGSGVISGTPTANAGSPYSVTVTVTDTSSNTATKNYSLTIYPAFAIGPATLPAGVVGRSYSQTLTATGGSGSGYQWGISSGTGLSAVGLTLSSAGVISGIPSAAETAAAFTVVVVDSLGDVTTMTYHLTIYPALSVTPTTLPAGNVGATYSQQLSAAGGSGSGYTFTATAGTAFSAVGLTLSPAGLISGTPSATETAAPVTIQVADSLGDTATQAYTLTINTAASVSININDPETITVNDLPQVQLIDVSDPETITVTDTAVVTVAYTIGGNVSGLSSGVSLSLLDNGSDSLTVTANGAFTFATALATGAAYQVTIGTQPSGETCTVTNGSGMVASANVTSVTVACKAATTTALLISPSPASAGQPVTFTASVVGVNGGAPTGTVTFTCLNYAPGQSINSGPIALTNGVANWTTTSLPGDIYNSCFVATYSGDGNFLASTSAAESLTVIDFQIEFQAPSNLTLWPGQSTTLTFTVAPANGAYNGTVNFAIAGLPADFPTTFDPPAVTLGSSPQIVRVTITVPSLLVEQEKPMRGPGSAAPLALALVLPLLGLGPVRRRLRRGGWLALAVLVSFIAIAGLSACIGGSGFFNQPPQTYTVTLTGISGTAQHSTTFNLTVE